MATAEKDLEAFKGEAGEPVGDMPPAAQNGNGAVPPVDEIRVGGTQMSFPNMGGKKPTSGKLTVTGLNGIQLFAGEGFRKGDLIHFEGVARVEEVKQRDKMDRNAGIAVECVQTHTAHCCDLRVKPAEGPALA